ncbi:MAG: M23 family metallopeptidase [Clostridia bacterium]|nr:M23 family metallopeptidase [Clostridia bacterium]
MIKKNNSYYKKKSLLASKGFYIALSLCVVAAGVTVFSIVGSPDVESKTKGNSSIVTTTEDNQQARAKATKVADPRQTTTQPPEVTQAATVPDPFSENIAYQSSFVLPISTSISKDFSNGELVYSKTTNDWRTHNGIDFSGALGSDVKSIISGSVLKVYDDSLWGKVVEINHGNGLIAKYCGFKSVSVKDGDVVQQGAVLGKLGEVPIEKAEVAHLHFETAINGKQVDPLAVMSKTGETAQTPAEE